MKTKHTEGEWLIRKLHEDQQEIILKDMPRGQCLATISTWGDAELEANVHLMAAAPLLLAALEALLKDAVILSDEYLYHFKSWGESDTIQGWNKSQWLRASAAAKQARAAIAAATEAGEREIE